MQPVSQYQPILLFKTLAHLVTAGFKWTTSENVMKKKFEHLYITLLTHLFCHHRVNFVLVFGFGDVRFISTQRTSDHDSCPVI